MSGASKRRVKRQINRLVRMDATRSRMFNSAFVRVLVGTDPATRFWETCMVPLGVKLGRKGLSDRALKALNEARAQRVFSGGKD